MATLRFTCLVFLPFFMVSVQAAPRQTISNILFLDENNRHNGEPSVDAQKQTINLSPTTPLLENKKPIRKSSKPVNRFPYLEDMRQNWGILINETNLEDEDEESYKRPINIPKPTETGVNEMVQRASKEPGAKPLSAATPSPALVSVNPNFTVTSGIKKTNLKPTSCDMALIVCCMRNSNIENCMVANNCFRKVVPSSVCQKTELNVILRKMKEYYS